MTLSSITISICRAITRTVSFVLFVEGIPENLRKKVEQIQSNGGKAKLDLEINIIKKNSELSVKSFQTLRKYLLDEEAFDNQKRQQYGQQWRRPPSAVVQGQYRSNIDCKLFLIQCTKGRQSKPIRSIRN